MKIAPLIRLLTMILTPVIPSAFATNQIIRPTISTRSQGMGGVRMTTGLYDENYFNNPARVTFNPETKLTLLQPTIEASSGFISDSSHLNQLNSNTLSSLNGLLNSNAHVRAQLIFPSFYLATNEERKFALAAGLIFGAQADALMESNYQANVIGVIDAGPALTFGHQFLADDALSIGATAHFSIRGTVDPNYSLIDYIQGQSFNLMSGLGTLIDFDIGTTYDIATWGEFDILGAIAVQNILGGNYIFHSGINNVTSAPLQQPRSIGLGVSATRSEWGPFYDTVFALEFTDIGNNTNGSVFKLVHLGGETHWKTLAIRLGLNQGYLSAGIGFDIRYFTFDFATYGEELGLNAGTFEDRRFMLTLGAHI